MTPQAPELLPCPCCKTVALASDNTVIGGWFVICQNAKCVLRSGTFPTKPMAVRAWNTRPTPAEHSTLCPSDAAATFTDKEWHDALMGTPVARTERPVPQVREALVERLRAKVSDANNFDGNLLKEWDAIRAACLKYRGSDLPRQMFEGQIENFTELMTEAADEIERLTARPSDAGVTSIVKTYIDSALRWHPVFDDGRGGNDLTQEQTSQMMCARLVAALALPPDEPARESGLTIEHRLQAVREECARVAEAQKYSDETKATTNGARAYGNDEACDMIATAIRALEPARVTPPLANGIHWLGDRESSDATRRALDKTGCVLYFNTQADCEYFMKWAPREPEPASEKECGKAVGEEAKSSIEYLQDRGRHYDIIREAIANYDGWMLDDDYESMAKLHEIIKRMRGRVEMSAPPVASLIAKGEGE